MRDKKEKSDRIRIKVTEKKTGKVHVIDKTTTDREFEEAKRDLNNFFEESFNKHHGGW